MHFYFFLLRTKLTLTPIVKDCSDGKIRLCLWFILGGNYSKLKKFIYRNPMSWPLSYNALL